MHTVTWLMALHLIFTYGPKAIDMANGIQQFAQHQMVGHASPTTPGNPARGGNAKYRGSVRIKR